VRFEAKFDSGRLILIGVLFITPWIALTAVRFLPLGPHSAPVWFFLVGWTILLTTLAYLRPAYCEIQENGLFLRQGWWHTLVPYDSVVELRPETLWEGPRFETRAERHRRLDLGVNVGTSERGIRLVKADGKRFWICVVAEAEFMSEALARCSQLNPATGMPLRRFYSVEKSDAF
jgi:hypothetical protein